MKQFTKISMCSFVAVFLAVGLCYSPLISRIHAEEQEMQEFKQIARGVIEETEIYDELSKGDEIPALNQQFINEMEETREEVFETLEEESNAAKENGKKVLTYEEIATLNIEELPISKKDAEAIIESTSLIVYNIKHLTQAYLELEKKGEIDNSATYIEPLNEVLTLKIPLSEISISHESDEYDGKISVAASWNYPYCIQHNGWGSFKDGFLNSDCFWALVLFPNCLLDHNLNLARRWCNHKTRNCSPLIGHSKYWHKH